MTVDSAIPAWQDLARRVGLVGVTGLLAGALAGWVGLLRADGSAAVAAAAAPWFWVLAVLAPAAVQLGLAANGSRTAARRTGVALALQGAGVGGAGGLLAALLFLVTASQVPAVFGGEEAAELMVLLRRGVFWRDAALLAAITALSGAVVAVLRK
jgi:hypothetical protein